MSITVKQVRAFVAVAKTRSFADASGMIHLSQPAISIAIKNLESAFGGQLFSRTTRALALTPEGEAFLPLAERLLVDWDDVIGDMKNRFALQRGKLTLAAMPSFACNLLPSAISRFRDLYPQINIAVDDVVAEEVVEMVRAGRVEIGITFDPVDSDDFTFEPLFDDRFIAALPSEHPLSGLGSITWNQLLEEDLILLQRPSNLRMFLDDNIQSLGLTPKVAYECHQLATVGRMVAKQLGVSVIPALCTEQMNELGAITRPLAHPVLSRRVGIITRSRFPLSTAARAMKQELLNIFRKTEQR